MKYRYLRLAHLTISILTLISILFGPFASILQTIPPIQASNSNQIRTFDPTNKDTLYRTIVTLSYPADLDRVQKLVTELLETGDGWALVVVDGYQLADLARLQFHPQDTVALAQMGLSETALAQPNTLGMLAEAPIVDSDGDGLSDTEESWWCTDPNDNNSDSPEAPSETNPSDGDEVQAILNGITAYGPPFALWPQFTPYNPSGSCPDGDFDGVPDFAEEFVIGTSQLRESSDKDKFDDGQELFGVTFCPAPSGPCGYGILPRAEDAAFVSANLPAWVEAPGNSPWVAAFPDPEIEIEPSSLSVIAVTTITTERTIVEGEEHTYGTATTKGTSTSVTDTQTWNTFEEIATTKPLDQGSGLQALEPAFEPIGSLLAASTTSNQLIGKQSIIRQASDAVSTASPVLEAAQSVGTGIAFTANWLIYQGALVANGQPLDLDFSRDDYDPNGLQEEYCNYQYGASCDLVNAYGLPRTNSLADNHSSDEGNQNLVGGFPSNRVMQDTNGVPWIQYSVPMNYPFQLSTSTTTKGTEWGGSHSTTNTEYEEQTISESSTNQFSEAWTDATAIDTAHAADLRFTYNIVNNGTEYAREISSLLFNIYIGDNPNPAYTYNAIAQTGTIQNLFPGESLTFTSDPIALNLDEMRSIDEGAPIRIVMEDVAYGQDQVFYQDALNGSVLVAMEDGFDDGDEVVDTYLIAVWNPTDTVQDVLKRYFPVTEDENGNLLSISTPEFDSTSTPIFNQHALGGTGWWNLYLSGLDYNGSFQETIAEASSTVVIRILSDRDLDGYNDRNESYLGTDPDDPISHPNPELLAGYTTSCVGNDCTVLMSFLNTGNYDAYGVEAIIYSPDGLTQITNNTIGGSGRVPAGTQVVLGTRILPPDLTSWTGGARPYSSGYYLGDVDREYTFTAQTSGNIGQSTPLLFDWTDGTLTGTVDFGSDYQAPLPLAIGQGLEIGFQTGSVNGSESFTVQTLTPRDTFQYTIKDGGAADPVIVVSYNDPQGNHRFILPTQDYPDGSQITDLNSDLLSLSGKMLPEPGVEIAAAGENQANFVLNAPHETPITDGHLFVEYLDSAGNVTQEDVFTQTLQTGPTVIPVTVDLQTHDPDETILLAFFTDSQGNIIDSSARPLASFAVDPLPENNLTVTQWQVGSVSGPVLPGGLPNPWDFGTVEAGTILNAQVTLANTGLTNLRYALTGTGNGLTATGGAVGTIMPVSTQAINLNIDTSIPIVGSFNQTLTLRTNDPANPAIDIVVSGNIIEATAEATSYAVSPYQPWDQYLFVPGPHNINDVITFTHTINEEITRTHPLYLYNENGDNLLGIGQFGFDTTGQTASSAIFGTGRDGDLFVNTGETVFPNATSTKLSNSVTAGENAICVDSVGGFQTGDEILITQITGTGAGLYEFADIVSIDSCFLTLANNLQRSYSTVNSTAQVLKVPHYRNVTVQAGGTITANSWNGNTGGIVAFRATGNVVIDGAINATGIGYPGGGRTFGGANQGVQGQGLEGTAVASRFANSGGGGGGPGTNDGGAGAGGGSHASVGGNAKDPFYGDPGLGSQTIFGDAQLTQIHFGGAGGAGGTDDSAAGGGFGGAGGSGGGIIILAAVDVTGTGSIFSNGEPGEDGDANPNGSEHGGGGGGAGGSIKLIVRNGSLDSLAVSAVGDIGGSAKDGNGGNGGIGRIRIEYCENIFGTTSPAASSAKIECFITQQGSVSSETELILPENILASDSARYLLTYGQRSETTDPGDHFFTVQLPNRQYEALDLSMLSQLVSTSNANINLCLDIGNDGFCDWIPAQQAFDGPVLLETTLVDSISLATAVNTYIQTVGENTPDLLVPIRVNVDTSADIFLFHLEATSGQDVDLAIDSVTLTPPSNIAEGTAVMLETTVSNGGTYSAENVLVAFYDGDPALDGILIDSTFIDVLPAGNVLSQDVTWNTTGLVGDHDLYVVVDPIDVVAEFDETNNQQMVSTTVFKQPDLIPLTITVPEVRVGETVTVTAVITNDGAANILNAPIALMTGTPLTGTMVTTDTIDVTAYSSATASWLWTPTQVGAQQLSVFADPLNDQAEADETNNTLSTEALVGWDSLTIDAGDSGITDIAYDPALGYGWLTSGTAVSSCGSNIEQTYRTASSTETLTYQFDNLLPGRFYHLDLTFATCTGERWVNVFVDGVQVGDVDGTPGSGDSVKVASGPRTLSILLDPAAYSDNAVVLTIERASGLQGPLVNVIDLQEVRFCYRDSGPGEAAWTAENGCGYDATWSSDGFNGWGEAPEETVRFSDTDQVQYLFTSLDPAKAYQTRLTFYEGDGVGRQQQILLGSIAGSVVNLSASAASISQLLPPGEYADGELTLIVDLLSPSGSAAVVSEVTLEEITRRYAAPDGPVPPPTPTPTPTATPPAAVPEVTLSSFIAVWNGSQVDVDWSTTTEINNAAFNLFRSTDGATWVQIQSEPSQQPCTNFTSTTPLDYTFSDTSVTQGTTYYYQLQFSGAGCGVGSMIALSIAEAAPTLASAPTLSATLDNDDLILSWQHASPNESYEVWRSTNPYFTPGDSGAIKLADILPPQSGNEVTYTDNTGTQGTNYYYVVLAFNAFSEATSMRTGKFFVNLQPGWNLLAWPLLPAEVNLDATLGIGLFGTADPQTADRVLVWNGDTQTYDSAWFCSGPVCETFGDDYYNHWLANDYSQSSLTLEPDSAFWVQNRSGFMETIVLLGNVGEADRTIPVGQAWWMLGSAFPENRMLDNANMPATGTADPQTADRILYWDALTQSYQSSWFCGGPVCETFGDDYYNHWLANDYSPTDIVLEPGHGYWYQNRFAPFSWTNPAP